MFSIPVNRSHPQNAQFSQIISYFQDQIPISLWIYVFHLHHPSIPNSWNILLTVVSQESPLTLLLFSLPPWSHFRQCTTCLQSLALAPASQMPQPPPGNHQCFNILDHYTSHSSLLGLKFKVNHYHALAGSLNPFASFCLIVLVGPHHHLVKSTPAYSRSAS